MNEEGKKPGGKGLYIDNHLALDGVALGAGGLFLVFAAYPFLYHCMTV